MWFKKLRKKKLQCVLIGLLLFLSSLIFTTSLSMMTSISGYVNKFYSNKKFYEIMLYNPDKNSINEIVNWCKKNPKISGTKTIEGYALGNNIYHKGKNLKVAICDIAFMKNYKKVPYGINKIKSLDSSRSPKKDDIWITQLMADNYNIKLGDKLTIKTKTGSIVLKVTSLINDSVQPASTDTQIFMYINKNSSSKFSSLKKESLMFIESVTKYKSTA
jgi:putative ABC transport system permease protein